MVYIVVSIQAFALLILAICVMIIANWLAHWPASLEWWARERWEHAAWHYWETHPEAKAEVERIADEVAKDMNLRERLFGPDA